MKNFIQPGQVVTLTAPYTVVSGAGLLVGSIFGVASNDALSGASVEARLEGVFQLAKLSSEVWTQGQLIYWDNTNKWCTNVASTNKLIGAAILPASNPSTTGTVRLNNAYIS